MIEDWGTLSVAIFDGVDIEDRAVTAARIREFFDQHKATKKTMVDDLPRKTYNSALWRRLNDLAKQARRDRRARGRVEKASITKNALKTHIKGEASARANATLLTDAVLAQLREAGVDLSPLERLTEAEA